MALYTVTIRVLNRGTTDSVRTATSDRNHERDFTNREDAVTVARWHVAHGLDAVVCTPHDGSVLFDSRTDR